MVNAPHRRKTWTRVFTATFAVTAVFSMMQIGVLKAQPARALDLPTWADVQAAKANEASAAAKVKQIQGLISQLQAEVAATQAEAERTMGIYSQAEADFAAADAKYQGLTAEAASSAEQAESASNQAAILAAQMYRAGGVDQSLGLLLDDDATAADTLLSKLAMMSKATERNTNLYEAAQTANNTATSLGAQAEVAKAEREKLKVAAQTAMEAAAVAAEASQTKLAQQQEQQKTLDAQLAALKDTTATTVAGYQQRVAIEEEQRRQAEAAAAAERARQAAAWAAQNGGAAGAPSGPWTRPSGGYVSGEFGFCSNAYCGGYSHTGMDFAAGCGTPIYAASAGTVVFSGWAGSGGNMVYINHGDGSQTRYAHLNSIYVGRNSGVGTGQVIGAMGSTGNSTGCHLHFETRNKQDLLYYGFVNPRSFMGARGVGF